MKKSRYTEEQIICVLKQMEAGRAVKDLARELGVSEATLYTWKSKYGGLEVNEARRLRELEEENRRLKHMVVDLSLDKGSTKVGVASDMPQSRRTAPDKLNTRLFRGSNFRVRVSRMPTGLQPSVGIEQ